MLIIDFFQGERKLFDFGEYNHSKGFVSRF